MPKLFALLDCNNFFASCERVFNPALRNKPVVVLSNNDGCVIARSNEAKSVGIGMGEPFFKCRDRLVQHKVFVYSANFVLYGDISGRVMQTAAQFTPELEIYSIDEAFLHLEKNSDPYDFVKFVRESVRRDTGMPVSIGVAATKTLSKMANHIAKNNSVEGVFCLLEEKEIDRWLEKTPVEAIWGIGHQKADFLKRHGIENALQLKALPDVWIKKHLTVISLKTVWELRGIACLESQDNREDKKGISTSRTFGQDVSGLDQLSEAVAAYIANACEKLRDQQSVCGYVQVHIMTNRFKQDRYYANAGGTNLSPPTAYTPDLIAAAKHVLKGIYRPGYRYKKAGVVLSNLQPQSETQGFLFDPVYHNSRKQKLMDAVDRFNDRVNKGKIFMASQGIATSWDAKHSYQSKRFTTRWDELLEIKI
jgi:DNA polymerase V